MQRGVGFDANGENECVASGIDDVEDVVVDAVDVVDAVQAVAGGVDSASDSDFGLVARDSRDSRDSRDPRDSRDCGAHHQLGSVFAKVGRAEAVDDVLWILASKRGATPVECRPTSFIRFSRDTRSSNSTIRRTVSDDICCMSPVGGETVSRPNEPRRRDATKAGIRACRFFTVKERRRRGRCQHRETGIRRSKRGFV